MNTNTQALGDNLTATRTRLACVVWIHSDDLTTSFCHFVVNHLEESTQRRIVGGEGQATVAEHERQVQLFNSDCVVGVDQLSRQLVPEVIPCVSLISHPLPLVDVGDRPSRACPVPTPFVQSVVVDGLHLRKQLIQQVRLLFCRAKSVLVRANHSCNCTKRRTNVLTNQGLQEVSAIPHPR